MLPMVERWRKLSLKHNNSTLNQICHGRCLKRTVGSGLLTAEFWCPKSLSSDGLVMIQWRETRVFLEFEQNFQNVKNGQWEKWEDSVCLQLLGLYQMLRKMIIYLCLGFVNHVLIKFMLNEPKCKIANFAPKANGVCKSARVWAWNMFQISI